MISQEHFNALQPAVRGVLSQVVTGRSWSIQEEHKDNLKRVVESGPFKAIETQIHQNPFALPLVFIRLVNWMSNPNNREQFARVIQPIVAAGLYEPEHQGQVVAKVEGAQGPADDGGHQGGPGPSGSLPQDQVVSGGNTTHHAEERGDDDPEEDDVQQVSSGLRHLEL